MKITTFLLMAPGAVALCPNSCSGQGECSEFDMCTCFANFRGADCSQRVCPYGVSWVTTAKGDLNMDGDTVDYTVYNVDADINSGSSASTLITQEHGGGDWESWPAYAAVGDGHFYMECSNRGLCDRETGTCECFAGYEGANCGRMVCPNDCSGKGVCQTTSYLTKHPSTLVTGWYDAAASSATYNFWDGEMALSCQCDPGYSGPDCSVRECPMGDDILTATNQIYETQFVEIFTECDGSTGASTTGCLASTASTTLAGAITLTYTDLHGEKYTTEPIDGVAAFAGETTHALATNAEAALKAIPNNVISSTITVTASHCDTIDGEQHTVDGGVLKGGTLADTATKAWRPLGACAGATKLNSNGVFKNGKNVVVGTANGAGFAKEGDSTGADCDTPEQFAILDTPQCIRLAINFDQMAGNIAALEVNVDEVTYGDNTNAQHSGSHIKATVTDRLAITQSTCGLSYTAPSAVALSEQISVVQNSPKTDITMDTTLQAAVGNTFYKGSTIEILCGTRSLGHYTVDGVTGKVITIEELIPASTIHSDCGDSGTTVAGTVRQISHVIEMGSDNDSGDIAGTDSSCDISDMVTAIKGSTSADFNLGVTSSSTDFFWASKLLTTHEEAKDSATATATVAYAILASQTRTTHGRNKAAASVMTIASSYDSATASDIDAAAEAALTGVTDAAYYLEGRGTHESSECGSRGLCDTEAGECKCFPGYIGLSCEHQAAIAM